MREKRHRTPIVRRSNLTSREGWGCDGGVATSDVRPNGQVIIRNRNVDSKGRSLYANGCRIGRTANDGRSSWSGGEDD